MSLLCPCCSSRDATLVQDQIKGGVKTKVLQCAPCDLHFLETWDDVEHVKSLYEGENYIFTHNAESGGHLKLKYDEYQVRYERLRPFLGKQKSLLEIGCGDGKFLNMIKNEVRCAEGLELSPPQVEKLRKEGFTCYDKMIHEMAPPKKYDIICMFALLEHVPLVRNFLQVLKTYLKDDGDIFIEVPNRNNALVSGVDITEFRNFYYRPIHLYYFNPNSLGKLLKQEGYTYQLETTQQASITNHFHWMYNRKGQPNANYMTSVVPPASAGVQGSTYGKVLEDIDNFYRAQLIKNNMGDLLAAHLRLRP
jgi:2-polyprenyl-3-methyl-5-hydroxy-6-metoxy-1,4-benzoquinol methylase